jgi:hypothetical protein
VKKYSNNEQKMFEALGLSHLLEHLEAAQLYRAAVEHAFLENLTGKAVDSLRKTANAFFKSTCYRHTPEFDALIEL